MDNTGYAPTGALEPALGWERALAADAVQSLDVGAQDRGIDLVLTGLWAHPERTLVAYRTDSGHPRHVAVEAVLVRDDGCSMWLQGIHHPQETGARYMEFDPLPADCQGFRLTVYHWARLEAVPVAPRLDQVAFPEDMSATTRQETYQELIGAGARQAESSGEVSRGGNVIWRPQALDAQALERWDQWLARELGEAYDPVKGALGQWSVDVQVDQPRRLAHFYWARLDVPFDFLGRTLYFQELCGDNQGGSLRFGLSAPARRRRLEEILAGSMRRKEGEPALRAWYYQGAVGPFRPALRMNLSGTSGGYQEAAFQSLYDHYQGCCRVTRAGRPDSLGLEIAGPVRLPALEVQALEVIPRERRFPQRLEFDDPGCAGDIRLEALVVGRGPITLSYRVNAEGKAGRQFKGLGLGLSDDRGRVYLPVEKGDFAPVEVETVSGKRYTVTYEPATELPGLFWKPPTALRLELEWYSFEIIAPLSIDLM